MFPCPGVVQTLIDVRICCERAPVTGPGHGRSHCLALHMSMAVWIIPLTNLGLQLLSMRMHSAMVDQRATLHIDRCVCIFNCYRLLVAVLTL
jgi:hypothetical protein